MHLKKDSTRSKNIWLVIDLALVLVALLSCVYFLNWYTIGQSVPDSHFEENMAALTARENEIVAQTNQIAEQIAARMEQSGSANTAAQSYYNEVKGSFDEATARRDAAQAQLDAIQSEIDGVAALHESIIALRTEYGQAVRQLEEMVLKGETEYRICYLTFDDGPSYLTNRFIEELDRLDAYATFFTIGVEMGEQSYDLRDEYLRREAMGGHTIANHTYTHAYYGPLYKSVDSFMDAVRKQDETVYNATGIHTEIVRFPTGAFGWPQREATIEALADEGFGWIDWTAAAFDAGNNGYSASYTASTVIGQVREEEISVVLMHDWKIETLGSLEKVITTLREEGYLFLPLFKESSTIGNVKPQY